MTSTAILQRLQSRAIQANGLLNHLRAQVATLRKASVEKACLVEEERLRVENEQLRKEVETLKQRLIHAEIKNGIKQVPLPFAVASTAIPQDKSSSLPNGIDTVNAITNDKTASKPEKKEPAKKESKKDAAKPEKKVETKQASSSAAADGPDTTVDVSRLNMRIGKIVNVKKHPDADSLYVEEVDVAEGKNRTIVSGLVKHIPIEQMQDRLAVFLLNLKPAKMRGVLSEGMIMCASTPEKVEIIVPPQGVTVGDRVFVKEYPGSPDDLLNPKKKIWEQIQPDLNVNSEGFATYKGALWIVENKGTFTAPTMTNCGIK